MDGLRGIGETSRLFGVRPSTLRFWEDEGLLAAGRLADRRCYDREDRRRIAVIPTWRDPGMLELGHIRTILDGAPTTPWLAARGHGVPGPRAAAMRSGRIPA